MKRVCAFLAIFVSITTVGFAQSEVIIQEYELGLCTYNGTIITSSSTISGWTGPGFIDFANGIGVAGSWEIYVYTEGVYSITWRYAFGGTATNLRDGKLYINGNVVVDTVRFPYTGSWATWAEISPIQVYLPVGDHKIRLEAIYTGGLANVDYIKVTGPHVTAYQCSPQYTLSVASNDTNRGTVSYSPKLQLYDKGTIVTLRASAKQGYFFESWTGEVPSNDSVFSFPITCDVHAVARFLPNSIKDRIDTTILGYATVQDDKGTRYLVTGGAEGDTVVATTLEELQSYLGSEQPYVVKFSGFLEGNAVIPIRSNKTLLGVGPTAHLKGIQLSINLARNVIVRNMTISHVRDYGLTNDALEINGASKNVVIDHCEFYSDRDHDKDYYDGLLDIKNQSTFITVSNCSFHDHFKAILISSGDTQYADTVIRITLHHNYFYNCSSRLPLIRFGKAHVFNNYYKNCEDAINTRMGACVRVERNYFENVGKAVFSDFSVLVGNVHLIDNYFGNSSYITAPVCYLDVPYSYQQYLHSVSELPTVVPPNVRTNVANQSAVPPKEIRVEHIYPNPFNPIATLQYTVPSPMHVTVKLYNILGKEVATLVNDIQSEGIHTVEINGERFSSGVYFVTVQAGTVNVTRRIVLLK
ncbi:MAG: T9SS type A sorting domain-containing protein [Bacteroidetes bacterium]|nr:T9SS type A sorting domain-containing protein [Bacteroidota bacterium]